MYSDFLSMAFRMYPVYQVPFVSTSPCRIALLWYHTIVRAFFALDGEKEDAGADEADRLLKEAESLYPNSALFLYFKGKVLYLR